MPEINNIDQFEDLFNRKMRGMVKDDKSRDERIRKYYELIVLKKNASPNASVSKETLRRISIVLTTHCNLKCVWCHREEQHVKDSKYLERHMDFEKLKNFLPKLKGFHVLSWGGLGEPMLYKNFYEATKIARKYVPIVKTVCNGTTLVKKNVNKLIDSGLNYLEVSIDGFDEDANLKLRGAHSENIISNIKYLSDNSDIPLQINTVVSEENYNSLFSAVEKLKDVKNIVAMHTIPLFMTKHMENLGIKSLDQKKYEKLLASWKSDINRLNLKIELSPDIDQINFDPVVFMKKEHNICFSPFEDPSINVDGSIAPCSRLQHLGLENVFEDGFENSWNGKRMKAFREEQLKGNYGNLCQRECGMKVTCQKSFDERTSILKNIHPSITG